MSHPFKIIRGGLSEDKPSPTPSPPPKQFKFAKFDTKQATIERLMAEIVADRDKYLDKKRKQTKAKR